MPEPDLRAGSGEQTEQTASTPAPAKGPDKQTTFEEQKAVSPAKGLMDFLDIPPEVQAKIAPKAEGEPSKPEEESTEPETPKPPAEEPAKKPGEQPEEEEEEEEEEEHESEEVEAPAAAQGQKVDKRQKRINRLTRRLHTTESQLDTALKNLQELQGKLKERDGTGEVGPASEGPLVYVTSERQLKEEIKKANTAIRWCNENKDGVTSHENGTERFVSPEEIAKIKGDWEQVILNAPERRDEIRTFTAERQHFDGLAQQLWPELFDRTSKAYQEAQAILELFPAVKASSRANYALGLVLEGANALAARSQQKAAKGNGAPKKPHRDISERVFEPRVPLAPEAPEPPSREPTPSSQKRLNKAMSDLVKDPDGSVTSLAAAFEALDEQNKRQPSPRKAVRV